MSEHLGSVLREARKRLGLTQLQVAERIGVTRAAVGQWESTGQVSTDNLIRACEILEIEVQAAIRGVVKPELGHNNPDLLSQKFEHLATRLERLRPKYGLARQTLENPVEGSFGTQTHPVYLVRDVQTEDYNVQISSKPYLTVKRDSDNLPSWKLYMIALGSDVLKPRLKSKNFVYASLDAFPGEGDIVLILPRASEARSQSNLLDPISFRDAWIGELVSISAAEVKIRQFNPPKEFAVDLDRIGVMHRLTPET